MQTPPKSHNLYGGGVLVFLGGRFSAHRLSSAHNLYTIFTKPPFANHYLKPLSTTNLKGVQVERQPHTLVVSRQLHLPRPDVVEHRSPPRRPGHAGQDELKVLEPAQRAAVEQHGGDDRGLAAAAGGEAGTGLHRDGEVQVLRPERPTMHERGRRQLKHMRPITKNWNVKKKSRIFVKVLFSHSKCS